MSGSAQLILKHKNKTPFLYLGSHKAAHDETFLTKNKITHILNVSDMENLFEKEFTYLTIGIEDNSDTDIVTVLKKLIALSIK
jgi:hypothetical protein